MATHFRLGALVLIVTVFGALLIASCSGTPTSRDTTTGERPSGSLNIAMSFGLSTILDPAYGSSSPYMTMGIPIFDSLANPSPDGLPIPGIAERWEISPDGKTHTFYIRKGVKFHDGSDLTGADVKFSIERTLSPAARHPDKGTWNSQLVSVELKDDYTVVLHLKAPQFELLKGLEDFSGIAAVVPKKYIEDKGDEYFGSHPVGTGPWKVLRHEPGARLEFEANENYWGAVPKFEKITVLQIRDEAVVVAMLKTGELDMAEISSPDSVPALKSAGLRMVDWYGTKQWYTVLFYDVEHPNQYVFGNIRVRKALSLATNRKEIADTIYAGYAEPSVSLHIVSNAFYFDPNVLKPDPYDPEGAKKLLAEAGYPNGFPIKVWEVGGGSILSTLNTALAGYWRKVGIDAQLVAKDQAAVSSMFLPKQTPEIWGTVYSAMTSGGALGFKIGVNYHSIKGALKAVKNVRLDELIDMVPLTADPTEKKRIALEAAVLAKNDYGIQGVVDVRSLAAYGAKVGGITPIKGMASIGPALVTITHAK